MSPPSHKTGVVGQKSAPTSQTTGTGPPAQGGVRIGLIRSVDEIGRADVSYPGAPGENGACPALTTISVSLSDVGRRVVLSFEEGRIDAPIIMGLIHEPLEELIESASDSESQPESEIIHADSATDRLPFEATIDEDRVILNAEKEIVLRCGKSSITLRKDGRVLIRGADVVSRSSGPNRIKGASVQVN